MISIVIPVRNNSSGLVARLHNCLHGWRTVFTRNWMDVEIVLVEWNPVPGCLVTDALLGYGGYRSIIVPERVHQTVCDSDKMPFFEYTAKNVGIRRAKGDWILCTNVDVVPSQELGVSMVNTKFEENKFYRAHRFDVRGEGANWLKYNQSGYDYDALVEYCRAFTWRDCGPFNAAGDFTMMHRDRWTALRGYPELASKHTLDSYMVILAERAGMEQVTFGGPLYHQDHDRSYNDDWPAVEHCEGWSNPTDAWGLVGVALEERS